MKLFVLISFCYCVIFIFDIRCEEKTTDSTIQTSDNGLNFTNIKRDYLEFNKINNVKNKPIKKKKRKRKKHITKNAATTLTDLPDLLNNYPVTPPSLDNNNSFHYIESSTNLQLTNGTTTKTSVHHKKSRKKGVPFRNSTRKFKRNRCFKNNGGCSQVCKRKGKKKCACLKGFELQEDLRTCIDIDECKINNGGCKGICKNLLGLYVCQCPNGFHLSEDDKSCEDINECLLRNGHGPCQNHCVNNYGSYTCDCSQLNGTRLSKDKHTCEDIDECEERTSGCSHVCTNVYGSSYCSCPEGFELMTDYKTCQDINECENDTVSILCKNDCINTPGSYYCGKSFQNNHKINKRKLPVCPKLDPPVYGYITCFRNHKTPYETYSKTGRKLFKNDPGTKCKLNCPLGFTLVGSGRLICKLNGKWSRKKGFCQRAIQPTLECPEDQNFTLKEGQISVPINFSAPKSNTSLKYLKSYPEWAKNFTGELQEGHHNILFVITDPSTHLSGNCSFNVTIKK